MADGVIRFSLQTQVNRHENVIAQQQAKIKQLEGQYKSLTERIKTMGKTGQTAFAGLGRFAKNFLSMYLGAGGIHAAISKAIELMNQQDQLAQKMAGRIVTRAQAHQEVRESIPEISNKRAEQMIANLEKITHDIGMMNSTASIREFAKIMSSTSPQDNDEDRIAFATMLYKGVAPLFRYDSEGQGEFGGSSADVWKSFQESGIPELQDVEAIIGMMGRVRSASRTISKEGVANLVQAAPTAGILFGGDDRMNTQVGMGVIAAMSSALNDITGPMSKTAATSFITGWSVIRDELGLAQDTMLNDTITAWMNATEKQRQEILPKFFKTLKGRSHSKLIQKTGVDAEGFLYKEMMKAIPTVILDKDLGTELRDFAEGGTDAIKAANLMARQAGRTDSKMGDELLRTTVVDLMTGEQGYLTNARRVGMDSWAQDLLSDNSNWLTDKGGVSTARKAIGVLEAEVQANKMMALEASKKAAFPWRGEESAEKLKDRARTLELNSQQAQATLEDIRDYLAEYLANNAETAESNAAANAGNNTEPE